MGTAESRLKSAAFSPSRLLAEVAKLVPLFPGGAAEVSRPFSGSLRFGTNKGSACRRSQGAEFVDKCL